MFTNPWLYRADKLEPKFRCKHRMCKYPDRSGAERRREKHTTPADCESYGAENECPGKHEQSKERD